MVQSRKSRVRRRQRVGNILALPLIAGYIITAFGSKVLVRDSSFSKWNQDSSAVCIKVTRERHWAEVGLTTHQMLTVVPR